MRNVLNERDVEAARQILQEVLELRDDTQSIVEREN
jgi:Tfp pilus assembly protein FimV